VSGSQSNYETLIEPIEDQIRRSVWRIVRDVDDAEDALQEASIVILKRMDRIRRHPNPHALVLRICANAAYDVLRKNARRRRSEVIEWIPETIPDPAPSARDQLSKQETLGEVFGAIGRLPRKLAEAALMRFAQELPYKDIAQALNCSESAARQNVRRARARLYKSLAHLVVQPAKEALK